MSVPEGIVTFLMTDIEGSTRHWEASPETMVLALSRHDTLASGIIARHDGYLVKGRGEGDSLFCVFTQPERALESAIALQLAISATPWETPTPLSIRIALHTGEADLRAGDYYGVTVNRCARLRSICRSGQILISRQTHDGVLQKLPIGARLRDLGYRQLRDLLEPEHLYEVFYPGLRSGPAREAIPNNLPRQLTSFVGREKEIATFKSLLASTCLLTLTGSGGVGKTRLALQAAVDILEDYPDGVWLIELASLKDPALVPQAIALALKIREEAGRALTPTLIEHLRWKRALLILDNCEHLLPGCALLAEDLLQSSPDLRIVATSREPLNIGGETIYRVPSLTLPDSSATASLDALAQSEAVRLFTLRAASAMSSFAVTEKNAATIATLCRRLDGIPLAIELAAVRVKSLPVEQIEERLADRFRLLIGGSRSALLRQQTLRALIDWSYDLLNERERELFHRLSVFVGGFTLDAAEALCLETGSKDENILRDEAPDRSASHDVGTEQKSLPSQQILTSPEVLDLLSGLVDKSLLAADEIDGRVRYRLLETLRQYAREKLVMAGDDRRIEQLHCRYFLGLAHEAERKLRGSEQVWWLERIDVEHDNLRAALSRTSGSGERVGPGLELAAALWWFWHVRGYFTEGREWLAAWLAARPERTTERARALNGAAVLASNQGDFAAARSLSLESLEIKRELGDRQGIASSLNNLAKLSLSQGDYAAAQPFYEESLAIERKLGNRQGVTSSLIGLGNVALEQGNYAEAEALFDESLTLKRELGDRRGVAASLHGIGSVALFRGDYLAAHSPLTEGLEIRRHLGDRRGISASLQSLATLAQAMGEPDQATGQLAECLTIRRDLGDKLGIANVLHERSLLEFRSASPAQAASPLSEALRIFRDLDNRRGIAVSLDACAGLLVLSHHAERAARLLGASGAIRKSIGSPLHAYERPAFHTTVEAARAILGEEPFLASRAAGRSLALNRAVAFALESLALLRDDA